MAIKGQIFELLIEDMTDEGAGIGKADGYPLFVKDTVVGDRVRAQVIKDKKTYGYGRLIEIIEASPERVLQACPVAAPCGGCQLQALSYDAQLRFKEKKVRDALRRIGGIDLGGSDAPEFLPIISMENPWHYRCKAEYPVRRNSDGSIVTGFYAGRTHNIVSCGECLIGQSGDRDILDTVIGWMNEFDVEPYDEETGLGLVRHIMIRTSGSTGEKMVCLIINGKRLPFADELAARLGETVTSFSYSVNTQRNNVIMGREVKTVSGRPYLEDAIDGIKYRISPQSFYQVNPQQTARLYDRALEFANLTGSETVWDLYCGIGTISLFLAKSAKQVYGVEIIPAAVDNARENAAINGIENAEFFVGKAEEVLPQRFAKTGERADVIVVDPPRKGCDETLLRTMAEMSPSRIVYVSCNPATLARDVKILKDLGYRPEKICPVDMFPQTVHVESIALLQRLSNTRSKEVTLDVDMKDYHRIKSEGR